jgi:hypothetical protein
MEEIKKELEPEFETNLDFHVNRQKILSDKIREEFKKQGIDEKEMVVFERNLEIIKKLSAVQLFIGFEKFVTEQTEI